MIDIIQFLQLEVREKSVHDLSQRSFFTVLVVIGRKEKDMVEKED